VPDVVQEACEPEFLYVFVLEPDLVGYRLSYEPRHVHRPEDVLEPAVDAPGIDHVRAGQLVDPPQPLDERRIDYPALFLRDLDVTVDWVPYLRYVSQCRGCSLRPRLVRSLTTSTIDL